VDSDPSNNGGAYRLDEGVDIEGTTDNAVPGYDVGWTQGGEWLNYTVNVTTTGHYSLSARVASQGDGGAFHIEMDGNDVSGPVVVPDTTGWNAWQSQPLPDVDL